MTTSDWRHFIARWWSLAQTYVIFPCSNGFLDIKVERRLYVERLDRKGLWTPDGEESWRRLSSLNMCSFILIFDCVIWKRMHQNIHYLVMYILISFGKWCFYTKLKLIQHQKRKNSWQSPLLLWINNFKSCMFRISWILRLYMQNTNTSK